jgi:hypothetical protein
MEHHVTPLSFESNRSLVLVSTYTHTKPMSYLFPSERALLYPQFETYRLHPLKAETNTASFPLPGSGATQSRVGYNAHHLSFKEVRARIGWDHLAVHGDVGIYIDKEWNVVGFRLDVSELIPDS